MSEVTLRDATEDDMEILFEHQRDEGASRMAAFPSRDRPAFEAHWKKVGADATNTRKAIVVDGTVAGNVVAFWLDGLHEVGYWIGRPFWGQGIATRALKLLLEQLEDRPLHATVAKHNVGSLKVLEKCGFRVVEERIGEPFEGEPVPELVLRLD
jgi:RimJ/RimL family protein N-acetyltransferase